MVDDDQYGGFRKWVIYLKILQNGSSLMGVPVRKCQSTGRLITVRLSLLSIGLNTRWRIARYWMIQEFVASSPSPFLWFSEQVWSLALHLQEAMI